MRSGLRGRSTQNSELIMTTLFLLSQAQPRDRSGFVIYWWWRAACDILAGVARHKAETLQVEWLLKLNSGKKGWSIEKECGMRRLELQGGCKLRLESTVGASMMKR